MRRRGSYSFAFYFGCLLAMFALSAGVSVLYVDMQSSRDARGEARGDAAFAARAAAKQLGADVALVRATVAQLAANPSIPQAVVHPAGCSLSFGGGAAATSGHLDILRPDGAAVCSSRKPGTDGKLTGYTHQRWVRAAMASTVFRAPLDDRATGDHVAVFAAPASGKAVVAAFLDLDSLGASLNGIYGGNRSAEFLVTERASKTAIARSIHARRWIGASVAGTRFAQEATKSERPDLDDVRRIYASAPVPGTGWELFVGEDSHEALAAGTRLRNRELAIVLSSLAVILLATIFLYRRLVAPMKRLGAAVKDTSTTGRENPVPLAGPTEVRALAGEINALLASVNAQEAVRRAREEAERANEAKSRFLSHMSHELRTPLAAIMGFAELLHRKAVDEKDRTWSGHILTGGRHLLELVNELLEISRIEAGNMMLQATAVDARKSVDDVLDLVAPLAAERGIRLGQPEAMRAPIWALADPLRLKQVLLNLVANAIKYNSQDGTVSVSVENTSDGTVRLAVTDTGQGLAPEQLERLFSPFERLGAEQGPVAGSGLGLVVTKGLVEAMGGKLDVESELESGTTFAVELPAALAVADAGAQAPALRPSPVEATSGDVLYIDDNPANLELVRSVFADSRPGLELRTSTEGAPGAELAERRRPDLLLLDLNLPDIAGEEVLRRLRARPDTAGVPVIVLSADSTSRNITRLLQSGADAYVTKPFQAPQFLEVVDRLLVTR